MKHLRLHSLIIFATQRIRREAYVWITLSHDHILPFLGITMSDDFGPLPALVSPWMDNGALSRYLNVVPRLSDHQKLELVGVVRLLSLYTYQRISDTGGGFWPLLSCASSAAMTPYTKDYTLVQSKGIVHGNMSGVGLVSTNNI